VNNICKFANRKLQIMKRARDFFKVLGPGLLYAGAAIGVSHLVQSTKAGAMFNFDLVWILILANFLKYPFFEFAPRYAVSTGRNLVQGYASVGRWALLLFTGLTVLTMLPNMATVTVVTVGLISYVFQVSINLTYLSLAVLVVAMLVLLIGRYSLLDKVVKFIMILLALSTMMAVFAAFDIQKEVSPEALASFSWRENADIIFLIAFVGWMPAPLDLSVWSSMWNLEKIKELGYKPALKSVLTDFKIGYIGTAIMAFGFLSMGALVMYGTGEQFSPNGTLFSEQLIYLYTSSLGSWAFWVVSIAGVTTMLSTTITVLDAYPRVLSAIFKEFVGKMETSNAKLYRIMMVVMVVGAILTIAYAAKSMAFMVTMATTLAFLSAPFLAWLNYRVVTDNHMPAEGRPGKFLRVLSIIGITFFAGFALVYVGLRF